MAWVALAGDEAARRGVGGTGQREEGESRRREEWVAPAGDEKVRRRRHWPGARRRGVGGIGRER